MYENEEILGISSLMENDYNHSKINELIKDDCNEEDNLTTNYGTMDYLNFHIPKIIPNEFFCGKLPFGEEYDDPMDIYRAVSKEELTFPNFVHDDKFMQLMVKMLKKNPTNRLWKFKQIKQDPYFADFDWNKLMSLSYPPPYMIKMKEEKENNGTLIPYLSYLQSKGVKRNAKKKKSNRQIKFEKWLKNF